MRASRLLTLLLVLQSRSRATAPELASELEVSVRTVYRDVAALQGAGVPLWTEPGPRGGIRLLDGWRTRLDGLTGDEAGALFLAGAPGVAADLGLGAVLLAAETKVMTTLPPELRSRADRMRERFHLDAPGWFHHPDAVDRLEPIAAAVWANRRIDIRYGSGDTAVARRLDPLGLVLKGGTWYLVARHRGVIRTWRVGRVHSVVRRTEVFARPDGFDLATWWGASRAAFDRSLLRFRCRVRVSPAGLRLLPHLIDAGAAADALARAPRADAYGWRVLELETESEAVAVSQLTGLGAGVAVLAPRSLRSALHAVGVALQANNRGTSRSTSIATCVLEREA